MNTPQSPSLFEHFKALPDPRRESHNTKRHELIDIIVIAILAVIGGADTWVDIAAFGEEKEEWLRKFLALPNGIPSHDTFGRVFSLLDAEAFEHCFNAWVKTVKKATKGQIVSIDGKTVRRAHEKGGAPLHLVSAFAAAQGVTLGQRKVDGKTTEVTVIPELLDILWLKGCIVTIDAIGCQGWIAKKVVQNKADYVLCVKANQGRLKQDLETTFENLSSLAFDHSRIIESAHGREEVRECFATADLSGVRDSNRWEGLRSVAQVRHTRTVDGISHTEVRHYISSLPAAAETILVAVRTHWQIENNLHWALDVSFREDESRVRIGHAQQNLSLVRKMALMLLKREKSTGGSIRSKRLQAGWNNEYLLKVIGMKS